MANSKRTYEPSRPTNKNNEVKFIPTTKNDNTKTKSKKRAFFTAIIHRYYVWNFADFGKFFFVTNSAKRKGEEKWVHEILIATRKLRKNLSEVRVIP